ncbi:MAG: DUF3048 domain-containing protein [Oscillospiraceae bacterium]|jgi:hypothetical protein|nr:DUF3048 domain-containing protein [Oscillospiraceae bacterium]
MRKKTIVSIVFIFSILSICTLGFLTEKYFFNQGIQNDEAIQSSDPPISQKILNPLTGLELKSSKNSVRPIAVMINNSKAAQPLLGVSKSDIMYEIPVEGGITRIMAIFQDPLDVSRIGSVRSARSYYINIANGHDAIYAHIGGSFEADAMMKGGAIDHFNIGNHDNLMWRDEYRKKNFGYEHSAVTSGKRLIDAIKINGTRYKIDEKKTMFQIFDEDSQILEGLPANEIEVKFSGYKSTTFTYDSGSENYLVSQFDGKQFDGEYNSQIERENILILKTKISSMNSKGLKAVELKSGQGFYMSAGKMIEIEWKKDSKEAPFKYKVKNGGNLIMLPGKSYICVVPNDTDISVS